MKQKLTIIVLILVTALSGQSAKYPYPVIFLHGLVSNNVTWTQAVNALGGQAKVFDVCLNHDGNTNASLAATDISVIGWRDSNATPSPTHLYVINFDNSKFTTPGHETHTLSNQAAIYKQGIALKALIQAVLTIEGSDKVILVGHSMGGLEAREYLQRGFNGLSTGRGVNWVDQSSEGGHRIAKLVTIGTPHLGSNHAGGILSAIMNGADEKSEACRDLRYSGSPSTTPYLFGGSEAVYTWNPAAYTKDVNCNGSSFDNITGINSGTTFNPSMPLTTTLRYTWITSNYNNLNQDGLVELSRQALYNGSVAAPLSADTMLLNINHIDEPNNIHAILRGIDAPGDISFAYQINSSDAVKEFMTFGSNWNATDVDAFGFTAVKDGKLDISLDNTNAGVDSIFIYQGVNLLIGYAVQSGTQNFTVDNVLTGNHYNILVKGTATSSTWQNPYQLSINNILPVELTAFNGKITKDGVLLNWTTATEKNNKGFEIQKSFDGKTYKTIGFIPGFGTSADKHSYQYVDTQVYGERLFYRLKQFDFDGTSELSPVINVQLSVPAKFRLAQNFPNPFNPVTVISYQLSAFGHVTLKVYDILGNEVSTLVNEKQSAGKYEVKFDGSKLASGVYLYKLQSGSFVHTRKCVFIK